MSYFAETIMFLVVFNCMYILSKTMDELTNRNYVEDN